MHATSGPTQVQPRVNSRRSFAVASAQSHAIVTVANGALHLTLAQQLAVVTITMIEA
jgi:hypothetical protein